MIEIYAVVFSLLSVLFVVMNKTISWPFGIVGIIFYGLFFYDLGATANIFLQFLFLIQSVYGWYNWNKTEVKISRLESSDNLKLMIFTFILFTISFTILGYSSIFDTITTSLSISAMYLLANRKIESWYYWILADILYITFFINIESYLSAVTYSVFLILAIIGLRKWCIEIKKR